MYKNYISLVIPIYNSMSYVQILFNSLLRNFDFSSGEIIIVDDCSEVQTALYLEKFVITHKGFRLFKNTKNEGLIKTANRGLKEAKGDICVILNSDTEIASGFNKKILDCFNSDNSIGVAFAIGSSAEYFCIPQIKNRSIQEMSNLLDSVHKPTYPIVLRVEGFCFCIRRNVIEQQGYLDEIYGHGYYEETDFTVRAIKNGWKSVLIDNLYIGHVRHGSFLSKDKRSYLVDKNSKIFKNRWGTFVDSYIEKNFITNPINKIKNKLPGNMINRVLSFILTKEKAGKMRRINLFNKTIVSFRKKS
ncbi:MAG: glycosyltransferase [Endomicrobium sp.]|jgi:GT2 family glycosyltransferase|nr:glycosyltransferase [Endomicrobium sp.]